MEQPTDSEEKIWIPYNEIRDYLNSLNNTLTQMSRSINTALDMIEENARNIKESSNE